MPLVEAQTYHSLPPSLSSSLYLPFQSKFIKINHFPFDIDFCANKYLSDDDNTTNQQFQNNSILMPNANNFIQQLIIILSLLQLIPFVLVYYIEECSPLVLFSWWRNKIS